ncbi:Sulfotransferase [Beggiatoa sp. PS]|nr:Sulfotransferase [Beggiatoa sp. PS]
MTIKTPIFLVGAERSGTTLLRLMLDHHPKIAFNLESEYIVDKIDANGHFPDLSNYHEYLFYNRIFLDSGFKIDKSLDYPALVNSFLQQKQERDNKPIIGATVHRHFDRLINIWPQAKFIHILRDGRDVARSNIMMGWAGNLFTGIDLWITAKNRWKKLSRHLKQEQHITVRYEDLIQSSEEQLTKICEFIGVPFDKVMFDYAERSTYIAIPD